MTREKRCRPSSWSATSAAPVTPGELRRVVSSSTDARAKRTANFARRADWTPRRSWRLVAIVIVASLLGSASIAGAASWVVHLTSATHPAQSQSSSVNAPTGGAASSPKSSGLALSWVKPSTGVSPTGYLVTRNGAAVPSGSGCYGTITTTSCSDTGLAASTTYTYSVKAKVGTNWTSVASATFSNTTVATFVVSSITSTNASGNTVGVIGVNDTFAVTFNNAVNPSTINTVAGSSTMTLVGASSTTNITIGGLTSAGGFSVSSNYETSGQTSTATGTLSLSNANKTVTFTVTGTPTNASNIKAGSTSTFTFTPLATIQDTSGDTASTSYSQSSALQIF